MRFDPVADPWGTAMLAAALSWALSLLVMLAALLGRTSRRTGGYLMIASLLAFFGAVAGGSWQRIQEGDARLAEASTAPPEGGAPDEVVEEVPVDSGAAAGGGGAAADDGASGGATSDEEPTGGPASGAATRGDATGGGATGGEKDSADATGEETAGEPAGGSSGAPDPTVGEAPAGDPAEPIDPDQADTDPAEPAEPDPAAMPGEPVVPEDLPKVDPLPEEPRARELAIREILEEATRAAGGGERCGNLQRVARAWAGLQTIPVTRKAKAITKDLERCRRRLLYSVSQRRLAEMIEARDAWFDALPTALRKQHGLVFQTSVSGISHQRLRIGNRELDAERADAVMDAGLRDDLVRLQFAHVVLTNGKTSKTYELPVTPEGDLGLPWLRAVGLGEPLRLAE